MWLKQFPIKDFMVQKVLNSFKSLYLAQME